jgi:hypothetical protein
MSRTFYLEFHGTYLRLRDTAADDSVFPRLLQVSPVILLVVVGLLACVLVNTVWLPTAHPILHPY